jgi:outer membrane murein-binding lipoprotein Lpp
MKAVAQSEMRQEGPGDPIAELSGKVDDLGRRVDTLCGRVDELSGRVDVLSGKVDDLGRRVDVLDAKFERHSEKTAEEFTAVRKEISEGFQRMQRLMIEVGGGIVVTLLVASRLFG